MSDGGQFEIHGNRVQRLWRWLRRPSVKYAWSTIVLVGFAGGIIFWGGFNWAVELSNTETFCLSCHEMRDSPYKEMQASIHFVNRTGARAICSDCHVPREWIYKVPRKVRATKDLFYHIAGELSTPEKFEAQRLDLALYVWKSMKETDSRECRNCHEKVWMDMSKQWGGAQRNHEIAIKNGALTCIDCHQGISHTLPAGFERPTPEQLEKDPSAWIEKMEALAAGQDRH